MKVSFCLFRPLARVTLAWLVAIAPGVLTAAPYSPPVPKPATNGSRFLFVYEMSSAMKVSDAANRQALFDMIFTGFDGQMRQGDSLGLWLFSEEVKAGEFPLQVWDEQNPLEVASRATQYVRAQKYSGKAHLEEVVPRILQLSRVVRDVHLVLISTGEQPIQGTPFDASINEAYQRKQSERKRHDKPLITTINVEGGKVVSATVTLPGQYIKLPERPPPPIVAAPAPAAATNKLARPVPAVPAVPTPASVEEPRTTVSLTVDSGPPTKTWKPTLLSATTTNSTPRARILEITTISNLPPAELVSTTPTASNATAATIPSDPPAPPAPTPKATESTPAPPPVEPAVSEAAAIPAPPSIPERLPVLARETPEPFPATSAVSPATVPGTIVTMQPGLSPILLLAVGATLLASCLVLLVLVLRRLRPTTPGSFITQSMERR